MNKNISATGNERFWSGQMISFIAGFIKDKTWQIKSVGGEATINTGKSVMFPDILLYGDKVQGTILQGWEIKMPDVSITNIDFIADAERKARILGLNSYVVWNFTYCKLFIKNKDTELFEEAAYWDNTNHIVTREDVSLYRTDWETLLQKVLIEINDFLEKGALVPRSLDFAISESIMPQLIERNKTLVAEYIEDSALKNVTIKSYVQIWWEEVKQEYMADEQNMYHAYAKTILVDWLNKFVFAHSIKLHHSPARKVEKILSGKTTKEAIDIFREVSNECDFYNIFKNYKLGELIPRQSWTEIIDFNEFLSKNDIEHVSQDTLQSILENTVLATRREIIGQYPTPPKLAELLCKITILDTTGNSIDPCCGTGTIPNQVIKYKIESGNQIKDAYETTWASDKFSFPLQVTNISLTNPDSINIPARVIQRNVFALLPDDGVEIVNPADGKILNLKLPKFDSIVSNLPFVDFNTLKREDVEYLNSIKEEVYTNTNIELSDRNDVYAYIIFSLWKNLSNGGKLGVIISNSWLGTDAGKSFYEALQWYYNIQKVVISGNGIWFTNADVVTTILVLEKKQVSQPSDETITFGLIKSNIRNWDETTINAIANSINVNTVPQKFGSILGLTNIKPSEMSRISKFIDSLNLYFYNPEWLLKLESIICPINNIFNIIRGVKTGQDPIFYLKDESLVNEEYIISGLKTSKNINNIKAEVDTKVFYCTRTRDELMVLQDNKTIKYLQSFESNLNASVKVRGRDWHILKGTKPVKLFTGMNPFKRIFYGCFDDYTYINQRLIGFVEKDNDTDLELCLALLNSIVGMFFVEANGFGMGQGALDINKGSFERMYMLNPELIAADDKLKIKKAFEPLKNRDIEETLKELQLEDRINFDHVVLQAYGIDHLYDDIKHTLVSLQTSRLSVKDN